MDIPILYEDENLVALDKPSGLVVHEDGRTHEYSVVDWVRERYPFMEGVGEPFRLLDGRLIERPGVVHRLDRDTSGVLVLAKNQEAFMHVKVQFQGRSIAKIYNAFVYGAFRARERSGRIDLPIGRAKGDFRQWAAGAKAKPSQREAVTLYQVLAESDEASYLQVEPKTGRTHQIRVHMKALEHPIVNDHRYAPGRPPVLGLTRLALHARSLRLADLSGHPLHFEAPLPADFERAVARLAPVAA